MKKHSSQINKLDKIVISSGVGRLAGMPNFDKNLPEVINEMALITGQKPAPRQAKQSISGFKLRAGTVVGLTVTLRRKKLADFLERLIKLVLPRIRDFRGISLKSVDKNGNLTIGIKEHIVFPEINVEQSKVNFGLAITIVPKTIKNRDEAIHLYRELGVPLQKK